MTIGVLKRLWAGVTLDRPKRPCLQGMGAECPRGPSRSDLRQNARAAAMPRRSCPRYEATTSLSDFATADVVRAMALGSRHRWLPQRADYFPKHHSTHRNRSPVLVPY